MRQRLRFGIESSANGQIRVEQSRSSLTVLPAAAFLEQQGTPPSEELASYSIQGVFDPTPMFTSRSMKIDILLSECRPPRNHFDSVCHSNACEPRLKLYTGNGMGRDTFESPV